MSTSVATPEQQQAVLKIVAEFQKALLPARLADTNSNGVVIAAALSKRSLPFTVENLIHVVNELLFSDVLTWLVEPKKLQAQRHEKPTKIDNPLKLEAEREAKLKATEAASALAKKNDKFEKLTRVLIDSYAPRDKRGNKAYRRQSEEQTRLRAYVDREIARNADRESIYNMVAKDIERLYKEEEREHTGSPQVQTDAIYPGW